MTVRNKRPRPLPPVEVTRWNAADREQGRGAVGSATVVIQDWGVVVDVRILRIERRFVVELPPPPPPGVDRALVPGTGIKNAIMLDVLRMRMKRREGIIDLADAVVDSIRHLDPQALTDLDAVRLTMEPRPSEGRRRDVPSWPPVPPEIPADGP